MIPIYRVYTSFSGLLYLVDKNPKWEDHPSNVYFFACQVEGIPYTFERFKEYNKLSQLNTDRVMFELAKAENQGRVRWAGMEWNLGGDQEREHAQEALDWLCDALSNVGAELYRANLSVNEFDRLQVHSSEFLGKLLHGESNVRITHMSLSD